MLLEIGFGFPPPQPEHNIPRRKSAGKNKMNRMGDIAMEAPESADGPPITKSGP